jgi:predicted dehydrogenase
MSHLYSAAVVGLGRIGSSYPSNDIPRTHAAAYTKNRRTELVACVDPDLGARKAFSGMWGDAIPVFASVGEMLDAVQPEIVSVCVAPEILPGIVKECVQECTPRAFFLEKPLLRSRDAVPLMQSLLTSIPTAVNYHRCWDPAHIRFFESVLSSGPVVTVRVTYGNGLFNYASHIIALLVRYFGSVSTVTNLGSRSVDPGVVDPSLDFILGFEQGFSALFQGFDELSYDLLEVEIITASGIYALKSGGCRRRVEIPTDGPFYPHYKQLVAAIHTEPDTPVEGLAQAVVNIVDVLDGRRDELSSDLSLGLEVFDLLWRVKALHSPFFDGANNV